MSPANHRHERVGEEIAHEINAMLAGELKDPRLEGMVVVSEVRVQPDMKHARVFINMQGSGKEQTDAIKALEHASGLYPARTDRAVAAPPIARASFRAGPLAGIHRTNRSTFERDEEGQAGGRPRNSRFSTANLTRSPLISMPRQPQPAPFDGALVIDKPRGKTSHDVVDAVRHLAGFRQIGHLGTLDPLATGVLVLLLGRATRLVQFYNGRRKRYSAGFRFGFATDTYDSDGEAQGPDTAPALDPRFLKSLRRSAWADSSKCRLSSPQKK